MRSTVTFVSSRLSLIRSPSLCLRRWTIFSVNLISNSVILIHLNSLDMGGQTFPLSYFQNSSKNYFTLISCDKGLRTENPKSLCLYYFCYVSDTIFFQITSFSVFFCPEKFNFCMMKLHVLYAFTGKRSRGIVDKM